MTATLDLRALGDKDNNSQAVRRVRFALRANSMQEGATAVRRLTERFARNICAFLVPLINAEPAYADVVRLELKEFAESDRPQFLTFVEYANRGTLHWFVSQLANAPGGPPEFLLE